jgi:hypothetical protein
MHASCADRPKATAKERQRDCAAIRRTALQGQQGTHTRSNRLEGGMPAVNAARLDDSQVLTRWPPASTQPIVSSRSRNRDRSPKSPYTVK